ncbi:MAG: nucleotidyltransferase family protein [Candidatus Woesearchaeota archaeon]
MKCIILCAGYSTRLYPLTLNKPKQLLEVGDKLMIDYIVEKVNELKTVDEIIVVSNNKFYEQFDDWRKNVSSNKKITIVNDGTNSNEERLGAVGDIHFAVDKLNINDDLLVIGGDNLFQFSLQEFHSFFLDKKSSIIAVYDLLDPKKLAKKFGVVELDNKSKIIGFEEKPAEPKTSLASTACYVFSRKHLDLLKECIEKSHTPDNLGDFIRWLSNKEVIYGFTFIEPWIDIGSPEEYKEVQKQFSKVF